MTDDSDLEVRLAQFEKLIERTAPRPDNPARCTCNHCVSRERPRLSLGKGDAA